MKNSVSHSSSYFQMVKSSGENSSASRSSYSKKSYKPAYRKPSSGESDSSGRGNSRSTGDGNSRPAARSRTSDRRGASAPKRGSSGSGGGQTKRFRGAYINPEKFIHKAEPFTEDKEIFIPKHKFADFGFSKGLLGNLDARQYTHPTPIQDQSIPAILEGRDFIGLANTGTGKTGAFLLPMIQFFQQKDATGIGLIVVPTRELAQQVEEEFRLFAKGLSLYSAVCVGGVSIRTQIMALGRKPSLVIGTPGRLKDLHKQKILKLNNVKMFVLDEVDRMLDMGFLPDIRALIDLLPEKRQSLCFSATITPEIEGLLQKLLNDPITVSVRKRETSKHINQDVLYADSKQEKFDMLLDLLVQPDFDKVLVFAQTKRDVQYLADELMESGIKAQAIHGNKSQPQRQQALKAFKLNRVRVLVATDVAARGLDIPDVSHVINFDQPANYEDYVHRIGRTGRAGKAGEALTFVPRKLLKPDSPARSPKRKSKKR